MNWTDCLWVEAVPGKVSGQPVIKGTRVLAESIPENYFSALEAGYTPEQALEELKENFPSASKVALRGIPGYILAKD